MTNFLISSLPDNQPKIMIDSGLNSPLMKLFVLNLQWDDLMYRLCLLSPKNLKMFEVKMWWSRYVFRKCSCNLIDRVSGFCMAKVIDSDFKTSMLNVLVYVEIKSTNKDIFANAYLCWVIRLSNSLTHPKSKLEILAWTREQVSWFNREVKFGQKFDPDKLRW